MGETWAEEVERLKREIGERQSRLFHLVAGDARKSVTVPVEPWKPSDGRGYYEEDAPGYDEAS